MRHFARESTDANDSDQMIAQIDLKNCFSDYEGYPSGLHILDLLENHVDFKILQDLAFILQVDV